MKIIFLSDSGKKRNRFRLPALTLEPGACVVLWPDGTGKSGQKTGEAIHLNFKLQEGDTLWFSSPYGVVLDYVTVPKAEKNEQTAETGTAAREAAEPAQATEDAAAEQAAQPEAEQTEEAAPIPGELCI